MKNQVTYATIEGSNVYHILQDAKGWIFGDAKCGIDLWLDRWYTSRPKGKRLCKKCKRSH